MSVTLHLTYASGYIQLGMFREAAAELARLDRRIAGSPAVLRLRAEIHAAAGEWSAMKRCARQMTDADPEDAQGWISLAYATRRTVSLRAARRTLRKAESFCPEEPIIKFNLACYAAQLDRPAEAARYLLLAIALDPECQALAVEDPDLEPLRERFEQGLC